MTEKLNLPEPLQALLGGVESSALTNFYGAPGTGKTNICLLLAVECIKNGGKVIYIDTEGGFSADRLNQLVENRSIDEIAKKINLIEPKDFKEQGDIIRGLHKKEADMIILDSAASLYRLEYADPEKEALVANRELSRQMSILSGIAREKKIPVIITSHTYKNWETENNEIVGGDSVKYWSKVLVFLERTGKMSERTATITKHRWMPEGKSVKFVITQDGIKPAGGFKLF
jgi:DNA repair protein RadB